MLKVGLTGSIATGKSYACTVFRDRGCHVLDADLVARDVVKQGSAGLALIIKEFGPNVIDHDGELDRAAMAKIVFEDESKRLLLNSIVHPLVFEAQNEWISARASEDPAGIAIVDAALLIESGGYKRFDKIIVVWCEPAIQLKRLMLRDVLPEPDARKRIAAQMPQDEKKHYADFLIDSSNGFEDTRRQVDVIIRELRLSACQPTSP